MSHPPTAVLPDLNFASIDIGSHTIRLLIARFESNQEIIPLCTERRITRLAGGFQDGEVLKDPSIRTSLEALKEYADLLKQFRVDSIACGATGVMRRARNAHDFTRLIEKLTGIRTSILSETDEAFLSAKGCLSVLPRRKERVLSFDLGGSSTELLVADPGQAEPLWSSSVFIGAATLTERYLTANQVEPPHLAQAVDAARAALSSSLSRAKSLLETASGESTPFQLVGTAGTVSTLAAMYLKMAVYEPYRINGLVLTEDWLTEAIDLLARLPLASRRSLAGLEKGREDIILGGALIVREILEGMGRTSLTVTDGGLLEGLLLDHIEKEFGGPSALISSLTWRLQKGRRPLPQ